MFGLQSQLSGVLYHPSSGWICHAPGQDPSHSDNDITQYIQHGLLQSMASSSLSTTVYLHPSIFLLSNLLPSELTTHGQSTPLADPCEAWLIIHGSRGLSLTCGTHQCGKCSGRDRQ